MTTGADAHQGILVSGRFPELEHALCERVAELKRGRPLAPVTVVVGSAAVRTHVLDLLVRRLGAVANLQVATLSRLAADVVASAQRRAVGHAERSGSRASGAPARRVASRPGSATSGRSSTGPISRRPSPPRWQTCGRRASARGGLGSAAQAAPGSRRRTWSRCTAPTAKSSRRAACATAPACSRPRLRRRSGGRAQ